MAHIHLHVSVHSVEAEIKHIRVNNEGDKYTLGKSKEEFDSIWDLVEAQLDRSLKSTSGDKTVELLLAHQDFARLLFARCFLLIIATISLNMLSLILGTHWPAPKVRPLLQIFSVELPRPAWTPLPSTPMSCPS
jgi:hypothetical protein